MAKPQIVAIIQARMGSTRLPGKVLMPILGKPLLGHVVNRVARSKFINKVVVATSTNPEDQKIVKFCKDKGFEIFEGSESDVLDRYYQAAKLYGADFVIRITADCPLTDPFLLDKLITKFFKGNFDHMGIATGAGVLNDKTNRYPQGLDASIFSFSALEKAWREAKDPVDREHVTVYIWQRPENFKLGEPLIPPEDYSAYRLTVDWSEDLMLVERIYKRLYEKNHFFGFEDIVRFLKENPDISRINERYLGETTKGFWRQKLRSEFKQVKMPLKVPFSFLDAVIVLSADETNVIGETKQRIDEGLKLFKRVPKNCVFMYLGVKAGKKPFIDYVKNNYDINRFMVFASRKESSTKTQIKDFAKFMERGKFKKIVIVTSAYHIPRVKRYVKRYISERIAVYFWPSRKISMHKKEIETEINKIINYSKKGEFSLYL